MSKGKVSISTTGSKYYGGDCVEGEVSIVVEKRRLFKGVELELKAKEKTFLQEIKHQPPSDDGTPSPPEIIDHKDSETCSFTQRQRSLSHTHSHSRPESASPVFM